jgi:hypothetical protein
LSVISTIIWRGPGAILSIQDLIDTVESSRQNGNGAGVNTHITPSGDVGEAVMIKDPDGNQIVYAGPPNSVLEMVIRAERMFYSSFQQFSRLLQGRSAELAIYSFCSFQQGFEFGEFSLPCLE